MFRIGIGHDTHRLVAARPLVLGGTLIPFDCGSDGHSDGDALTHAIADAKHICRGGARPRPSSFENAGRDKPCPYKLNNASETASSSLVVILMFIDLPVTT